MLYMDAHTIHDLFQASPIAKADTQLWTPVHNDSSKVLTAALQRPSLPPDTKTRGSWDFNDAVQDSLCLVIITDALSKWCLAHI